MGGSGWDLSQVRSSSNSVPRKSISMECFESGEAWCNSCFKTYFSVSDRKRIRWGKVVKQVSGGVLNQAKDTEGEIQNELGRLQNLCGPNRSVLGMHSRPVLLFHTSYLLAICSEYPALWLFTYSLKDWELSEIYRLHCTSFYMRRGSQNYLEYRNHIPSPYVPLNYIALPLEITDTDILPCIIISLQYRALILL